MVGSGGWGEEKAGKQSVSAPSAAQRSYLERGVGQPGGKLPLFNHNGQQINHQTIRSCISCGWAEPWFDNPIKPDWLVCRLTEAGYRAIGAGSDGQD